MHETRDSRGIRLRMLRTAVVVLGATCSLTVPAAAQITVFTAALSGAQAAPPTPSTATGFVTATLNQTLNTLQVTETFSGLTGGNATAAHIHCCTTPGTATIVAVPFPAFPPSTSGTFSQLFDLTSATTYNAAFITANGGTVASARAALIAGMFAGLSYANIHNQVYPAGEISGHLIATPEPASLLLFGTGLLLVGSATRRRSKR